MLALRRISAPNALGWHRGRIRKQNDIDRLSPAMMNEFSDPNGLSIWLAENEDDIDNIAAAISFQHGKGCADCTFASASWSALAGVANASITPGGTGCSAIDHKHREITVPDHGTHVNVVGEFLKGSPYTVPQNISRQRILSMIEEGVYNSRSLIRALPGSKNPQHGDSLIAFAKEGLMELNLAVHPSLTYSWRRVPGE